MEHKKILLVQGGVSGEREISLKSGQACIKALRKLRHKVIVFDPVVDTKVIEKDGFFPASLDEIYAKSDIISLHCPVTDKTRGMINNSAIFLTN